MSDTSSICGWARELFPAPRDRVLDEAVDGELPLLKRHGGLHTEIEHRPLLDPALAGRQALVLGPRGPTGQETPFLGPALLALDQLAPGTAERFVLILRHGFLMRSERDTIAPRPIVGKSTARSRSRGIAGGVGGTGALPVCAGRGLSSRLRDRTRTARSENVVFCIAEGIAVGSSFALPAGPVGVLCVRRTLFEGPIFGLVFRDSSGDGRHHLRHHRRFGLTIIRDLSWRSQDWLGAAGRAFSFSGSAPPRS